MMSQRALLGGLVLVGSVAVTGCSSGAKETIAPPQTVEMDGETLRKFQHEVEEYVERRKEALKHIPPLDDKSTPTKVDTYQNALTNAIITFRRGSKRGDIFKPEVEQAIRRMLHREFSSPQGPAIMQAIRQGNPRVEGNPLPKDPSKEVIKNVTVAVNARYPETAPYSSVPPTLLLKLPLLPPQVRYRFIGRSLILRDTEADVILDFIPDVVPDPSIPR
jgi:hypothetical protein